MRKAKDARTNYAADGKRYTPAEYLARERAAAFKSEYYDGAIVMMAGAKRAHNIIVGNMVTMFNTILENKPCEVYPSDMRVQLKNKHSYVYPDVVVVCGKPEFIDRREDTLANPTVIVEVLSPSTYRQDFTKKFAFYKQLASLQAYIMVDSEQVHTWCIQRDADSTMWHVEISNKLREYVRITALDCALSLRRIYAKVQFDEPVK